MAAKDRQYWERRRVEQEERLKLWDLIEKANTPEEVMNIMTGQLKHYSNMSADQYRQPAHSKLMNARNQLWTKFWDALEEVRDGAD
tara:strand:- start:10897 stop:11154 length:258 start_codon:yes stop_codon:yes gene_type:complete